MVRARLRMKAARISNRTAKLDTEKWKTVTLEHLRLNLRNRFEGLHVCMKGYGTEDCLSISISTTPLNPQKLSGSERLMNELMKPFQGSQSERVTQRAVSTQVDHDT